MERLHTYLGRIAVLPLLLMVLAAGAAATLKGKVISVTDGDTFHLRHEDQELKVRLAEILTPERGQPYGYQAKQVLSELVLGKHVSVAETGRDQDGRIIGRVYVDDEDVNAVMVKLGYAWVYREYARDPELFALENQARTAKRGIWALAAARNAPPWEWGQEDER